VLFLALVACSEDVSPSGATGPTIAFLFDGSLPDAELVTSPALAGLELAAHQAGAVEIEPVNVGLDHDEAMASLHELGTDRGTVAAVVAPWTAPPEGAIELLAAEDIPVVTLSWAWGPPQHGHNLWLSFVAGRAQEAVILLSGAARSAPDGASLCLAGDEHVTSRSMLETARELGIAAGEPELLISGIAVTGRPATVGAVAARVRHAGCALLVWIGGAPAAASVLSPTPEPPPVVGTSRMKTDEGLEIASSGTAVSTVCACADVSLSTDLRSQHFVHDLQAESGSPPGPFAVEAYDAGRLLIGLLGGDGATRGRITTALGDLTRFSGLVENYSFEPDGSRVSGSFRVGMWRAAGSRWLPERP
jgi:ABC-type branched-subunit amino acid transport system substrate-binding protein